MTRQEKAAEREEACTTLHEHLKPGDTVCLILRSVSRSGMTRHISTLIQSADGGGLWDVSHLVARATGNRLAKQGVIMGGCGMDMGFALVYELGCRLWPQGTPEPHGRRNGEPDSEGGYALRYRWL